MAAEGEDIKNVLKANGFRVCKGCGSYLKKSAYYLHLSLPNCRTALYDVKPGNCRSKHTKFTDENERNSDTQSQDPELTSDAHDPVRRCDDSDSNDELEPDTIEDDYENSGKDTQQTNLNQEGTEVWEEIEEIEKLEGADTSTFETETHETSALATYFVFKWQKKFNIPDVAINTLLIFLKMFITLIGRIICKPKVISMGNDLPGSLYSGRKLLGVERDNFTQYVVCPSCHILYKYSQCYTTEMKNGSLKKIPKTCSHISYPNHPHTSKRQPCGNQLLKVVKGNTGKEYLYPIRIYCYQGIKSSLERLVTKTGFREKTNKWRERTIGTHYLSDIYDGEIWKHFDADYNYFEKDYNLCITLNIDWFQPFDHTPNSVGAIYCVINNLPLEERQKRDNVILVGLLDGPDEPKNNMNSYLKPLVEELHELWKGVHIQDTTPMGNKYRVALMCLTCDIPACRKSGGFVGHGALRGCSKCLKEFPREQFGDKANYGGFDQTSWKPRSDEEHFRLGKATLKANTPTERAKMERESGARYSVLFELEYYLPVSFHTIDVLHNLMLGSAKLTMMKFRDNDIITDKHLTLIQERVDAIKVPSAVGKIPSKIKSGFSGFTGNQWMIWVTIYSAYALRDILPDEHFTMWTHYIKAVKILCSKTILRSNLKMAHQHLFEFCSAFEKLFDASQCTMNMHLHMHLVECINYFGPSHSFWCFNFERMNGLLGNYPTNNHAVTLQMMRKFISGQQLETVLTTGIFDQFQCILQDNSGKGALDVKKETTLQNELAKHTSDIFNSNLYSNIEEIVCFTPKRECFLDEFDYADLLEMYKSLYPAHTIHHVSRYLESFPRALYNGTLFSVVNPRHGRSACICAKWISSNDRGACIDPGTTIINAGSIRSIYKSCVQVSKNGEITMKDHVLVEVQWYKPHPNRDHFKVSCSVHSPQIELAPNGSQFIPIQRILYQCAIVTDKVVLSSGKERVNVVVPL